MEKRIPAFISQLHRVREGANCIPNAFEQSRLWLSVSIFFHLTTHTQEAPLPCSPLSHDLVRIVKISPFDKANWTTCQRMFSSLVNHICSLISTHSRTQQTLHHLIQSTSHCCESSTGSRRGQEETERLRDNERKKERKEVIKRSLGR